MCPIVGRPLPIHVIRYCWVDIKKRLLCIELACGGLEHGNVRTPGVEFVQPRHIKRQRFE